MIFNKFRWVFVLLLVFSSVSMAEERYSLNEGGEEKLKRRPPISQNKYFGFGPTLFRNLNVSGFGFYFTLGYAYDTGGALIRVRGDIAGRGGAYFGDLGLGITYFLSQESLAPFVGADFGYGFAVIPPVPKSTVHGFVIAGLAGAQLLRTTTVSLEMAFRYALMLEKSTQGHPVMGGFRVGLYF